MGPGLTTGLTSFSIVDLLLLWTPLLSEWRGSVALPRVEPVERPPRHHRPLDPLPQVCPLSVSASNNVKISSRLFKEVISEINIRLPREPTEEFSAGMAILNLLARSTTQMFPTNVELGTFAAHIFIFDKHLTGARQLLPFGRSGLPEVAVVAGLLLLERFPNNFCWGMIRHYVLISEDLR